MLYCEFKCKADELDKEQIEKLGHLYRSGCYTQKQPDVCHLLGEFLEGIKKDFNKAAVVYRSTCDDYDYGKSCYKFANCCFLGKGRHLNQLEPLLAFEYYEKGCRLNDGDSCLLAGLMLISRAMPKEIVRNVTKGFQYLTKSCEMNNSTACFYLSGMFLTGVRKDNATARSSSQNANVNVSSKEFFVEKDLTKAFEFASKACGLGNVYACANLSQMYARGEGVARNDAKAAEYKNIALAMRAELKAKQQQQLQTQTPTQNQI